MNKAKQIINKLTKDPKFIIVLIILVVLIVAAIFIYNKKYSPTNETMTLNEYYEVAEGEMALIVDGELETKSEGATNAIVRNETPYVRYDKINDAIGDIYAYDSSEKKVSYTTVAGTYQAGIGSKGYTFKGNNVGTDYMPCIEERGTAYLALEFVKATNGMEYTFNKDPYRATIYTPGKERTVATINDDTPLRRFGGNRSKIVASAKDGDEVTVVENYGSWSQVLTKDGELGCVPNGYISDKETITNKTGVAQENLKHNLTNDIIRMGWHQVFSKPANNELTSVLETTTGMNVISPTWLQINTNRGGLNDLSSPEYVKTCHDRGIKVWVLVSNIERDIDESILFNTTSSRENLVNNIINSVVSSGADGINLDMESVSDSDVVGYVEFVKELALKCNERGLELSVDNYNLNSADYMVDIQSRFADYIVLFGYDETWTGSPVAGSNNSMKWVKKSVEGMLDAGVDKKQLILAIPFYTRLWKQTGNTLTCEVVTLKETPTILSNNNATETWLKDNKENYAEWTSGDSKYMVWIVDNKSLKERCAYAMEKNIAGIATWKLGNETKDTWNMIAEIVQ